MEWYTNWCRKGVFLGISTVVKGMVHILVSERVIVRDIDYGKWNGTRTGAGRGSLRHIDYSKGNCT